MKTNKQKRDKIVRLLDQAKDFLVKTELTDLNRQANYDKTEQLIVSAIAELYRLNL